MPTIVWEVLYSTVPKMEENQLEVQINRTSEQQLMPYFGRKSLSISDPSFQILWLLVGEDRGPVHVEPNLRSPEQEHAPDHSRIMFDMYVYIYMA